MGDCMNVESPSCSSVAGIVVPHRVQVLRLVRSRYAPVLGAERPASWDARTGGADVIETLDGRQITLVSSPMQSPPKVGWILMLTAGDEAHGFQWTLYGLARGN